MTELRLDLTKVDRDLEGNYDMNQFAPVAYVDPLAEDELSPLQRLKQYCQHEDPGQREIIVRLILDAVDDVRSGADFELILEIVFGLANDIDPEIRTRVLSTLEVLLEKNAMLTTDEYREDNEQHLFEIPLRMMTDFNQQVRKASQNTIVSIISQNRAKDMFMRNLCSVMAHCLGRDENCDVRVDTLFLITQVAPLLGRDLCLDHFVPLLPFLASDSSFHVKRAVAMCCKEICPVLDAEIVDTSVLPFFLDLCQDSVWGVRKACAEVYADVAASCTMESRYSTLTPAFLKLLRDDSKWVRKTAYQTLGPFISTFYNPDNSQLNKSDSSLEPLNDSILRDNSLLQTSALLTSDSSAEKRAHGALPSEDVAECPPVGKDTGSATEAEKSDSSSGVQEAGLPCREREAGSSLVEGTAVFDEHTEAASSKTPVWKSPLPPTEQSPLLIDVIPDKLGVLGATDKGNEHHSNVSNEEALNRATTVEAVDCTPEAVDCSATPYSVEQVQAEGEGSETVLFTPSPLTKQEAEEGDEEDLLPFLMDLPPEPVQKDRTLTAAGIAEHSPIRVFVHSENGHMTEHDLSLGFEGDMSLLSLDKTCAHAVSMDLTMGVDVEDSDPAAGAFHQEIVPEELMEIYLSIMEQGRAQSSDGELQYHCAFSLPAVVQTLGRSHWKIVKPVFDLLAVDQNWKIRRVLAFSLHELAKVLGFGLTCSDLVPVLMEICTKDIDDVKIGALSHLAEFFELLPLSVQAQKLVPVLHGLLDMENERNWRYRQCLAEQLALLCNMLDCDSIQSNIAPVALKLAEDKVAEVRKAANSLLGVIVQHYFEECPESGYGLLKTLRECYACHESYFRRLMYVKQAEIFLKEGKISNEIFAVHCLPTLLTLSEDRVSNVRLAIARVLKDTVMSIDYFKRGDTGVPFSPEKLKQTSLVLQKDVDRDVRYFAGNADPLNGRLEEAEERGENGSTHSVQGTAVEEELEFFNVEAAKC